MLKANRVDFGLFFLFFNFPISPTPFKGWLAGWLGLVCCFFCCFLCVFVCFCHLVFCLVLALVARVCYCLFFFVFCLFGVSEYWVRDQFLYANIISFVKKFPSSFYSPPPSPQLQNPIPTSADTWVEYDLDEAPILFAMPERFSSGQQIDAVGGMSIYKLVKT